MYEGICYEKPFLKQVLVVVNFVAPIPGLEKAMPPRLANEVSVLFPISEPVEGITRQLQFSGAEVRQQESPFKQWNFFGNEREKQLSLTPMSAVLIYHRYTTYEHVEAEFTKIVDAMEKAFPDTRASRFGLRYINVIEGLELATPTSWNGYFASELLGTITFFRNPESLTRLIHIAEMKLGDLDVRFQFGMPNPDYPAAMRRPQFVLDLDAYIQSAHNLRELVGYMGQAHDRIQTLFEGSITDKLREYMHAKPTVSVQQ